MLSLNGVPYDFKDYLSFVGLILSRSYYKRNPVTSYLVSISVWNELLNIDLRILYLTMHSVVR